MRPFQKLVFVVAILISLQSVTFAQSDLTSQVDDYLSQLDSDYFSGAVLIVQNGETVLREGYGFASAEIPVTPETVFDIGSISKQFTAAAVLHLQDRGLLDVNDSLSTYFEDVPDDKASITLHQLLTHTSGLQENHFEGDLEPVSREEALERIFAHELQPQQYAYSNSGYSLLAAVIEIISGETYQDYLRENLFTPAGMEHTGFYNDAQWETLTVANGYWNGEDQGSPATWAGPYWTVMGNGGIMSTVDDMYRWWQALQGGDVLEEASLTLLFTPHVPEEDDNLFYGYGWSIEDSDYGQLITHNGGGIGGNSDFAYYVDQDLLMVMLTNRIVFKEAFGLPCRVEVPATETSQQLAANLFADDFSTLPEPTFAVC